MQNFKYILLLVIVFFLVMSGFLVRIYVKLSSDIEMISKDFLKNNTSEAVVMLNNYFDPIEEEMRMYDDFNRYGYYDDLRDLPKLNKLFLPLIMNSKQITSIVVTDTNGNHFACVENENLKGYYNNRLSDIADVSNFPIETFWKEGLGEKDSLIGEKIRNEKYLVRKRPWFLNARNNKEIQWTTPYSLYTTGLPGISISKTWFDPVGKRKPIIVSFHLLVNEISKYTSNVELPGNSMIFVLDSNKKVLGLPNKEKFKNNDSIKKYILRNLDSLNVPELNKAMEIWKENNSKEINTNYSFNKEKWWMSIHKYPLSKSNYLYIGVLAPESDLIGAVKDKRLLLFLSFGMVIIALVLIIIAYSQKNEDMIQLEIKKKEIDETCAKLNEALHEKEILIKEVHHRVKNNLQIVISLLKLQSIKIHDAEARLAFKSSQDRIASMALLHEKLYKSKSLALINVDEYLTVLAENLINSYSVHDKLVTDIKIDEIKIDIDTILSLGLLLNELIINTLKYAFTEEHIGKITIRFVKNYDNSVTFEYSDNGKGLPDDFDPLKSGNMGFEIIRSLTHNLDGKMFFERGAGFHVKIIYPPFKHAI